MEFNLFKNTISKIKKRNIAIMGHMGSGKSVFGKKIANYFNLQHIDIDEEIVKFENTTINKIFSDKGGAYFREIESKITLNILKKNNTIISLGGGSILNKKIREKLNKQSLSIFLDVDIKVLNIRLKNSQKRPLLKDRNILTTLKQLDAERRKYYLDADIKIDNSGALNKTFLIFKKIFSSING